MGREIDSIFDSLFGTLDNWEKKMLNEKYGMINVTGIADTEQKWCKGPEWKYEWEAKWDSSKKEDKTMFVGEYERMKAKIKPEIKDVIFNNPATIVKWADGTKTVVKVQNGEPYDEEKGLAMAFVKKIYGNKGNYNDIFRKWCPKKEVPVVDDFTGTVEEMFEDLFADDYVCESCKIDV